MEEGARVGRGADGHDHVADLRHRRVGDDAFDVRDDEADRARDQQRHAADDRADVGRGRRPLEERVQAPDQVDAGGHHRRRVDQRGDRRRALHRVREPRVQRYLRGLRERADEDQDHRRDERRVVPGERLLDALEQLGVVEHAHLAEQEERAEHEADVADDVDDEGLDAGARRRRAPVPVGDQHVARRADERPADDQQDEVAGQHQQQHREDEEVQVREEARVAAVGLHVADRVEVDQRRDAADDQDHQRRQRIDVDPELDVDAGDVRQVPERRGDDALLGGQVLELEDVISANTNASADRRGAGPAGGLPPSTPRPSSAIRIVPASGIASTSQAEVCRLTPGSGARPCAHPCSSRSSSTSIGRRRR